VNVDDGAEVLIVGSGPAGVSAAWPLLEAGLRVRMIDPGRLPERPSALDERSFEERRANDDRQWRLFLGPDASILENASPKLRAPEFSHVFQGFRERYAIAADGFAAHGSLAPGGLSNAWGSGVGAFTGEELAGYPLTRADLQPSYAAVARRIGINGSASDDLAEWFGTGYALQPPYPVERHSAPLLRRYEERARRPGTRRAGGLRLGRPQQAVLTEPLGGRGACDRRAMCIYGCRPRAIYNAADELPALRAQPGFRYEPGWFATRVSRRDGGFTVQALPADGGATRELAADRVLLAAGTLGSTKLALELLGAYDAELPLQSTPVLTFALVLAENLLGPPAEGGFALGQLAFALRLAELDGAPEIFGGIIPTTGMLPAELYGRVPMLSPFARSLGAWLWPRLLVSACFFPGTFTENALKLRRDGGLDVRGRYRETLAPAVRHAVRRLRGEFGALRALLLPGTTKLSRPGEEMHYGATIPMRASPGRYETDREGRLPGIDGLHVVDGAVLSSLPAKSHTFTIMANADRIARAIAAKPRPARA
jgi:choline dehydrogenase-like flavoprotein